jgi:NitT/TauT family transport system permease protein
MSSTKRRLRRLRRPFLGGVGFAVVGLLWELSARYEIVNPFLTSRPNLVWDALVEQLRSGQVWTDLQATGTSLVIGFALAAVVGIVVGVATGWYRRVEFALDPIIWFGYSAPLIAFYPLFIVMLGIGRPTIVAITFLFALVPIIVNTQQGIKNVDSTLVRAARSLGANDIELFRKVILPGSVPMIMAGFKLGIGRGLLGGVVAELFGGTAGLGVSISRSGAMLRTTDMLASVILVVIVGVLLTHAVTLVERRVDSWRGTNG